MNQWTNLDGPWLKLKVLETFKSINTDNYKTTLNLSNTSIKPFQNLTKNKTNMYFEFYIFIYLWLKTCFVYLG